MIPLTAIERETILNYNTAEDLGNVYTCDRSLINKVTKALGEWGDVIQVLSLDEEEGCAEFLLPKKWIGVKIPRRLTDEQKKEITARLQKKKALVDENTH